MSVIRSARKNRVSSKSRHQAIAALSAATGLVAWATVSRADTFGFNDSSTVLSNASAWTDESSPTSDSPPPGVNDNAQFDSLANLTSTTTLTLGTSMNWGTLTVLNPGAAIVIGTVADSTNTLTIGSTVAGATTIDMSSASQNLTIVDPLILSAVNQSFVVNTGQTLTLNGPVSIGTDTLTFGGGGTQVVNGAIGDGGAGGSIATAGSGTVVLTASNTFSGSVQIDSGVTELNFAASGAPASNILSSAAELRLQGGTLLVNGGSGGGTQSFASAATNGPTYVTAGLSTVQVVNNATVNLGTITVNNISTNFGGHVDFIGPATSSDGNNATPVAATGTITVGSTTTSTGGLLVDPSGSAFAVVGQANGQVTDFAALNGGVVVGGSTISGFYTGGTTALAGNGDVNTVAEYRYSGGVGLQVTTLRFNTTNGGLYNGFGNDMDQLILKNNGKVLQTGAVLVTPNVGPNNVLLTQDQSGGTAALTSQNLEPLGGGATDFNIFQYNTQAALILNSGIHDSHSTGYAQSGPGTVEMNADSQTGTTSGFVLGAYLNGGLTILGNFAQGGALASASSVVLSGGNLNADYTGNMDDGFARPVTVNPAGGSISSTTGNTLTIDGVIGGSGALGIGYGAIATNEASNTTNTVTQNLPSAPNTAGNGYVILSGTNTYSGGTNVNYGTLQIDTGTAGTGPIVVAGSGSFAGNALLTNATTMKSGSNLYPGDPIISAGKVVPTVGTLGVGKLNLNSGSITNFGFSTTTSYGQIDVNGNLVLATNAQIDAYQSGSSNAFTTTGTYDIFVVTGSVSLGVPVFGSNAATYHLSTAPDPSIPGDTYVVLTIAGSTPETWNTASGGSWATAANWYPAGVPNSAGATAEFLPDVGNTATIANGGNVTLDGNETVGTVIFQNSNSFTISSGTPNTSVLHILASGTGSGTITDSQGSHTINAPVSLDSSLDNVSVMNAGNTLTFNGSVEGVGALAINPTGHGTIILNANNTYGGATTIGGGTLQVGTGGATGTLGTNATPIVNLGALIVDTSTNQTLSVGPTSGQGTGSLTQQGTGTLALTGTNNAGAITINHGEIQLAAGASLTSTTADLTMAGGTMLDLNGGSASVGGLTGSGTIDDVAGGGTSTISFGADNNTNTFSGQIQNTSGTVSVVKSGNGTQTLSAINTYTGGTTISGGAILVTQDSGINSGVGSGTVTVGTPNGLQLSNGVTLSNPISITTASAEYEDVPSGSATLSGAIAASGSAQYRVGTSGGTLTLTGASTAGTSSIVIITRGNVIVDGNGVTGAASITSSHTSSAVLIGRQSATSTLNLTIENGGQLNSADGVSMASNSSSDDASMNLTVVGSSPTVISSISAGGTFNLNNEFATNTSAGAFNIALGAYSNVSTTAFVESSTNSSTSTSVVINGGTITATANDSLSAANTSGTIFLPEFSSGNFGNLLSTVNIAVASGGATINNGGFNITLGEPLYDSGGSSTDSVTYAGTGTTVLANANYYNGSTTIAAGTVVLANGSGSATSSGTVFVTGGTLASASSARVALLNGAASQNLLDNIGSGSISGPVVVGAAGIIAPGEVGTIGTLSLAGLSTVAGSTLNFDLGAGTAGTPTSATGDYLILSGTVSIGSGTLVTLGGTPTVGDDYRLIGGSVSGININDFTGLPAGEALSKTADPGYIDLVVTSLGPPSLTWNDASGNNLWDVSTSSNWNNGSSTTTYTNGANVTFNDNNGSAAGRYSVTLNSTVLPASMVVNNSTGNYSISGTGTIGGTGSLTKSGTGTLTLATANSYSGGTNVSAGLLMVEPTSSTTSALPKGSLSITGGEVQLATNVTQGSQSANVPITAPTSNVNITSLSISGSGKLDIVNNHIIIDYGTNADPIASIAALIADGAYGSGTTVTWTGTGITSSAAALIPTSYGIGYADALDPGNPAGLASGTIEVMYTLLGDANLDGKVNGSDFNLMATNFNQAVTAGWDKGDFNYDGKVNGNDFVLLAANFNQFASQSAVSSTADQAALDAFAAANGISLSSVPEPASTGLLALGVVSVMARRRRKAKA